MTQSQALSILKTGASVFLTGEPGAGKTHTINSYVAYLRSCDIEPAITASTGIAATHIGGMTIHSWSGIGIKTQLEKHDLDKIATSKYVLKRVLRTKVLIIDEVSMLSPQTLGMVDAVCRKIKQNPEPFGGIQVVLVGDFFQLPPIIKTNIGNDEQDSFFEDEPARFAFDSHAFRTLDPTVCYLTEQHRQDDGDFLAILSAIRNNSFNDDHLAQLATRKVDRHNAPTNTPQLFSHNIAVDRVNNEVLDKLPDQARVFEMNHHGPEPLVAAIKKGCLSPEKLILKIDAAVIFTKNNPKEKFVNGTVGIVQGFNNEGFPIIRTKDNRLITVEPMAWSVEDNGVVKAYISQIPLRLAWAITVHKSQGMSLDEAIMDLGHVFEFGQGYVALSRLRRLSGLHLLNWNEMAFQVHPEILAKDAEFRYSSENSNATYSKMSSTELTKMQTEFITASGGKISLIKNHIVPKKENIFAGGFNKIREKHADAYKPWDDVQDNKLRDLYTSGAPIANLAAIFNRTKGSIRSRLVKLELVDD